MGPKDKNREVSGPPKSDAGGGTVVSTGNFGYDTRGNVTPRSISSQGVRELRV